MTENGPKKPNWLKRIILTGIAAGAIGGFFVMKGEKEEPAPVLVEEDFTELSSFNKKITARKEWLDEQIKKHGMFPELDSPEKSARAKEYSDESIAIVALLNQRVVIPSRLENLKKLRTEIEKLKNDDPKNFSEVFGDDKQFQNFLKDYDSLLSAMPKYKNEIESGKIGDIKHLKMTEPLHRYLEPIRSRVWSGKSKISPETASILSMVDDVRTNVANVVSIYSSFYIVNDAPDYNQSKRGR